MAIKQKNIYYSFLIYIFVYITIKPPLKEKAKKTLNGTTEPHTLKNTFSFNDKMNGVDVWIERKRIVCFFVWKNQ